MNAYFIDIFLFFKDEDLIYRNESATNFTVIKTHFFKR